MAVKKAAPRLQNRYRRPPSARQSEKLYSQPSGAGAEGKLGNLAQFGEFAAPNRCRHNRLGCRSIAGGDVYVCTGTPELERHVQQRCELFSRLGATVRFSLFHIYHSLWPEGASAAGEIGSGRSRPRRFGFWMCAVSVRSKNHHYLSFAAIISHRSRRSDHGFIRSSDDAQPRVPRSDCRRFAWDCCPVRAERRGCRA